MTNNNVAHTSTGDVLSPDNTWMNSVTPQVVLIGTDFFLIAKNGLTAFSIASFTEAVATPQPARAHFMRALMDAQGNLLVDSSIRILDPATGFPIIDSIYADAHSETLLPNPFITTDGLVNFYLHLPRRVNIGVVQTGNPAEFVIPDVDLFAPPPSAPSP